MSAGQHTSRGPRHYLYLAPSHVKWVQLSRLCMLTMKVCAYQGDFQIFFETVLRCAGAFAVAVSEVVANAFAICSLHGAFTQWVVIF